MDKQGNKVAIKVFVKWQEIRDEADRGTRLARLRHGHSELPRVQRPARDAQGEQDRFDRTAYSRNPAHLSILQNKELHD